MHIINHEADRPTEATIKDDILDGTIISELGYVVL